MEVGGVLFFAAFLRPLHDLLATKNDCSCIDGGGKLFWGIKNLSSCCFLVAIKFFSYLSVNASANMLSASRRNQGKKTKDAIDQSGAA